jgi:hypothetical protein
MRTGFKVVWILGLVLILSACGSSGGGGGSGNLNGGEATCSGPDCGRDGDSQNPPSEQPTQAPADPTDDPTGGPDVKPTAVPPLVCGGAEDVACPDGYHCVADPRAANCDPATGVECTGICVLGEEMPGCGGFDAAPCPEGSTCIDDLDDDCEGGPAVDCPGLCRPTGGGECSDDFDCPVLELPCPICADGSTSCPRSSCVEGKCSIDFKPCSEAQPCGGISGLACDPGFVCVDDPTDNCVDGEDNADCRGICVPDRQPPGCGGIAGMTCPPGFECVDLPGDDCDPDASGADCPSVCEPGRGDECTSDADCPLIRIPCSVCADGSESCPSSVCENGICNVSFPSCPPPPGCQSDADCPPEQTCQIGANGCDPATGDATCGGGVCVPKYEPRTCGGIAGDTCPPGYECLYAPDDGCDPNQGASDCKGICVPAPPPPCNCASIQAPCNECPDGTFSCPHPECLNGTCTVWYDACREPGSCGGVGGIPCPPGLTCVDAPNDDCDPNVGADCPGVCRREEKPLECAGFIGAGCPDGYECIDSPDECDPNNGGADCPGFCRPLPGNGCASDADCVVIGAPCQMCADGTAACPRSSCVNGECRAEFPTCGDGNRN